MIRADGASMDIEQPPGKDREDPLETQRPQTFADFNGQAAAKANLEIFVKAARRRGEALDHVLFVGPPGLGKTTLAQVIANEMGAQFKSTSGPVVQKAGDLAAILTSLDDGDVLFIDEIHRLAPAIEEILYPAMEDFRLDLIIGEGPTARSVQIDLARFTLVAATTRIGLLSRPLRDRFGIPVRLQFYTPEELSRIVVRGAGKMGYQVDPAGAAEIAGRSRGTPRIAGRLLRRVRDFAEVSGLDEIGAEIADLALSRLDVDRLGLDLLDQRYLDLVSGSFSGGPVGIDTIAAAMSEPRDAIEDLVEPFLLQLGFVQRTPRGRILSDAAMAHVGRPRAKPLQPVIGDLFSAVAS